MILEIHEQEEPPLETMIVGKYGQTRRVCSERRTWSGDMEGY